jgi:hypothetical protein
VHDVLLEARAVPSIIAAAKQMIVDATRVRTTTRLRQIIDPPRKAVEHLHDSLRQSSHSRLSGMG